MKFVKCSIQILLIFGLASCGGNAKKTSLHGNADAPINLVSTEQYIPVPKVDKTGAALPYEAKPNPYIQQRGKVDKESIARFIEAKRAIKVKQYKEAERILTGLTSSDKTISGPWQLLGDLYVEQKDYPKAITCYQQSIEINKYNVNSYLRLALAQRLKGDFLAAQNTYAEALAVWPDSPETHLNLAVLYDVYLNHPMRAQKHMEAYQFLTVGQNKEVRKWLDEIQQRTNIAFSLDVEAPKASSKPLGY